MAEINLGQLLKDDGYEAKSFNPDFPDVPKELDRLQKQGTIGTASYYKPNAAAGLGMHYFLPVTIEYNVYGTAPVGSKVRPVIKTETIELPFPVLSITGKKRLVETYLTQRNGTVKELISSDGYEINIKGYIIGQNGAFPEEDIKTLQRLFEVNEPVTIYNVVTNIFLYRPEPFSDKVVITELSFPEARGNKHVREYEMKLVNDAPFNLMEIKNK